MARVLITGTSTGIGKDAALHLGRAGHEVIATMRQPDRAPELQEAVTTEELPVSILPLDVDDDTSVRKAVATALEGGPIDVLINNAGITVWTALEETPVADLQRVMETNFVGPMRCAQAVLPGMRERGEGLIINVTSIAGRIAILGTGPYGASKAALESASETLAQEVRPYGVRVAILEPRFFETPIINEKREGPGDDTAYPALHRLNALAAATPQAPTSITSARMLEIMESDSDQLRWPAGPDAEPYFAWRGSMSDEEWVAYHGVAKDETWYAAIERDFQMDVRPKG